MTVTPYCKKSFQSRHDLYHFLSRCQQERFTNCLDTRSQLISISTKIAPIDPLTILHQLVQSHQISFYFEQQSTQNSVAKLGKTAIAAMGAAAQIKIQGRDRFLAAQRFINATLANRISIGETEAAFAGAHFFCSFSFAEASASTLFLPAWQISRQMHECTVVANLVLEAHSNLERLANDWWKTLETIRSIHYELPAIAIAGPTSQHPVATADYFKGMVASALTAIEAETFRKVVLAHAVDVRSPLPFNPIATLHNLRTLYPDCTVFAISDDAGQFVGASPERLVSLQTGQLLTDALAGSAPRGNTPTMDATLATRLLNSTKERHEHRIVRDFITRQLANLGIAAETAPLRLLQLSNIQHLHTPLRAIVPAAISLLDIVAALHPTPAVAGVPRSPACEFIRQHEPFPRSRYAAPIGWLDQYGNGEFVVGIRSATIQHCTARLYAGAGIVAGSDPDRELTEVRLKLRALLAALV